MDNKVLSLRRLPEAVPEEQRSRPRLKVEKVFSNECSLMPILYANNINKITEGLKRRITRIINNGNVEDDGIISLSGVYLLTRYDRNSEFLEELYRAVMRKEITITMHDGKDDATGTPLGNLCKFSQKVTPETRGRFIKIIKTPGLEIIENDPCP